MVHKKGLVIKLVEPIKKKILYLIPQDVSVPTNGTTVMARHLIDHLSDKNEVHLIHMVQNTGRKAVLDNVASETRIKHSDLAYFLFSPKMYRAAKKLMEKTDFDIIFTDTAQAGTYGILLSNRFVVPLVYYSHNVEYLRYLDQARTDFRRYLLVPYMYLLERFCCKTAKVTIAITEMDKKKLKKWTKNKIIVVPGGFDAKIYNPFYKPQKNKEPIILFFGSFNHFPNKEAAYIIRNRILVEVLKKNQNIIFQIVGENPPEDITHPNIKTTGFVSDLVDYIRRADMVIVPIVRGGGIRMKIIESLACGKTVISTFKGASGIPNIFSNLHLGTLEEFPSLICQAITRDINVESKDYNLLQEKYAYHNTLTKLEKHVDLSLKKLRKG
jgi:glycosyltransferase involved in cell wall biosynthesis